MVFRQGTTVYLFSVLTMKNFIVKTSLFSLPIILLSLFTFLFYSTNKGDLKRIGYVINIGNYRSIFKKELEQTDRLNKVSEINLDVSKKYTVLTIGDSFTGQIGYGYKNYLDQKEDISVLYFNRFLAGNPLEATFSILNGDLLDKIKVDYLILQSVERKFLLRAISSKLDKKITINSIKTQIQQHNDTLKFFKSKNIPFGNRIVKFPLQNVKYFFDDNGFDSETYIVKTKQNLFSVNNNNLLFLNQDVDNLIVNNNPNNSIKLNELLNDLSNKLRAKDIKLIVLPCPDKYDLYYNYIIDNKKYPRPLFFENFEKLPKTYLYINSKKILKEQMKYQKDIYFYDDTHWSPRASKIIANELEKVIRNK